MFSRKQHLKAKDKPSFSKQTVIGVGIKVDGTFVSEEDVLFSGIMEGNMDVNGVLHIMSEAQIAGNIKAYNIIIEGSVEGECKARYNVEIRDTGKLKGDVYVGDQLVIAPGATFLGKSNMLERVETEFIDKDPLEEDLGLDDEEDDFDIDLDDI